MSTGWPETMAEVDRRGLYSFGRPVVATRVRMPGSMAYRMIPGQSVIPVSRWPEIVRSFTFAPAGYRVVSPPPEVITVRADGLTWATSRRQASNRSSARTAGSGGRT